jgi:hypothetical protein
VALALGALVSCAAPGGVRPEATVESPLPAPRAGCLAALRPVGDSSIAACPDPRPGRADFLDTVLEAVSLTRCDLGIPRARVARLLGASAAADRFRLPFVEAMLEQPLRLPAFARETVRWLDEAVAGDAPASRAIQAAAHRLGHDVGAVCPIAAPPVAGPRPLATAVAALIRAAGGLPDDAALAADAADVPAALQAALAPIVDAIVDVVAAREAALARVDPDVRPWLHAAGPGLLGLLPWVPIPPEVRPRFLSAAGGETFDHRALYAAAARLARTVEVADLGRFADLATGPFDQDTPWGRIVLRGPGDDLYDPAREPALDGDLLLVADTGGDDVYRIPVAATRSPAHPVSVAIDLGGDDTYAYGEVPDPHDARRPNRAVSDVAGRAPSGRTRSEAGRQGAGRLGVALLFDLGGGRDRYRSLRASQGYGQFGVGVLYDDGGDDDYRAEALAQGAGLHGIGLLLDRSGHDRYAGYTLCQGLGGPGGVGALVDGAGDDRYEADVGDPALGGDPLYPAPQMPERGNASLCQGAGVGIRPGAPGEPRSASGGLGILRDAGAGDDVYLASVFAQGAGYWFGVGLLQDGGGDDAYDGLWYVQGAAAHAALAGLIDEAGHDRYNQRVTPITSLLGVGHDAAVGLHLDLGGDDVYRGAGLALGGGSDQGVGAFVNIGGHDLYDGSARLGFGSTAGSAFEGPRGAEPTHGVFVDVGGADVYQAPERPPGTANDAVWRGWLDRRHAPGAARGAGGDAGHGVVAIP